MFQYFSVRNDDDLIRNSQNPLLMGNDQNGTFNIASHLLKYLDQILETPASGSSKIESFVPLARIVAISILLISPPERLASTSRFT